MTPVSLPTRGLLAEQARRRLITTAAAVLTSGLNVGDLAMRSIVVALVWLLVVFVGGSFGATWPAPTDTLALALLDSLPVARTDIELAGDDAAVGRQIWGRFGNSELTNRYGQIVLPYGVATWPVFAQRLLRNADRAGFDVTSLALALAAAAPPERPSGPIPQFPIGAFLAQQGDEPVWIIPCVWVDGYIERVDGTYEPIRARHAMVWAFAFDGRQVGFVTCK